MATLSRRGNKVRVQVRRRHLRAGATFPTFEQAAIWADDIESGRLLPPQNSRLRAPRPFFFPDLREHSDLMSEAQIVEQAHPIPLVSAIYFLVKDGHVVYVGQSINVHTRLVTHRCNIDFDAVYVLPAAPEELLALEARYIAFLRPPLNLTDGNPVLPLAIHRACR